MMVNFLYQMDFLNMPHFNRKYPSGAEINKEKVRKHKG